MSHCGREKVQHLEEVQALPLATQQGSDRDTAANNIAQCVFQAGARLYQLESVGRDLDTVFREVNSDVV